MRQGVGISVKPSLSPRVVVIGAGAMGAHHARVIASLRGHFQFAGVLDVRASAAEPLVARFGGASFVDERSALDAADHVIVATPIESHARIAQRALLAHKSVLVEKPLAGTSREALELVEVAEQTGSPLFVGHSERFNPVIRRLVRALAREPVVGLSLTRQGPASRGAVRDHGVLLNLGVHDLDLVSYLSGSACDVTAATGACSPITGGDDWADVALLTRSGVRALVRVDRLAPRWTRSFTLHTECAVFEADLVARTLTRTARDGASPERLALDDEEPLRAQALAVARALGGHPSLEIATGDAGARAVQLAEMAIARISAHVSRDVRWIA